MKKIVIEREFNDSHIAEVPNAIANDNQTLLKVKAVGICQSDIGRVFNQAAYYYPITLGHEFSGETVDGRKATVFPIIPCFECPECKKHNYAQCKKYSYYGSREDGGMSQYIPINNWNLIYNDYLDFDELAVIEPCAVAMRAVKTVPTDAKTILINGCGFISLVAAQILLSQNKKVYIRNRNQAKLQFALNNFNLIEYGGEEVDCAIDFVSNSASLNFLIDYVAPHATIIAVGNPVDEVSIEKTNYSKILRKELHITGTWNSKREDWFDVINLIENKRIDVKSLISNRFDFEDFKSAFEMMRNNQLTFDKPIIKTILTF